MVDCVGHGNDVGLLDGGLGLRPEGTSFVGTGSGVVS